MRRVAWLLLAVGFAPIASADEAAVEDAIVLYDAGEARSAEPLFRSVAQDTDEPAARRGRAFLYLALCQSRRGDSAAASLSFRHAFQLDPGQKLPGQTPSAAVALANAARAQLGLRDLAEAGAPSAGGEAASLPKAEDELERLQQKIEVLRARGAPAVELDRLETFLHSLRTQLAEAQRTRARIAASAQAPDEAPPQPPPPEEPEGTYTTSNVVVPPSPPQSTSRFFLGAEVLDVGFLGTRQASPSPALQLGYGDSSGIWFSFLAGAMLGSQTAYDFKLRSTLFGTRADPVGWNWTVDTGVVTVPATGTLYLELSSCPLNVTWRVAKNWLLEARLLGIGYYWSLDQGTLSTWSLEGGFAMRWLL